MARAHSDAALTRAHSDTRRSLLHLEELADEGAFVFVIGFRAPRAFEYDGLQRTPGAVTPGLVAGSEVSDREKLERQRGVLWVE